MLDSKKIDQANSLTYMVLLLLKTVCTLKTSQDPGCFFEVEKSQKEQKDIPVIKDKIIESYSDDSG